MTGTAHNPRRSALPPCPARHRGGDYIEGWSDGAAATRAAVIAEVVEALRAEYTVVLGYTQTPADFIEREFGA